MAQHDRTRVKVCGLTREQDVKAASDLGIDAIGFVFYPKSRRHVTVQRAAELARVRAPFVSTVALFVEPDEKEVHEVIDAVRPTYLQFHGDETPEFCARFNWPYIKAFRVGAPGLDTPQSLLQRCLEHREALGWLFDSYTPAYGGSGQSFDHALLSAVSAHPEAPVVLSGGLTADNVMSSILTISPVAVDVSSSVEVEPGVKCAQRLAAFVRCVHLADQGRAQGRI
jgi:phosphoribosylanthranilate isomerase